MITGADVQIKEKESLPSPTREGIISFLAGSFVKGTGKVFANRIYESTGSDILQPDFDFTRLNDIEGLGSKKIKDIEESIKSIKSVSPSLMAFLYSTGLSDYDIEKIIAHYKDKTERILIENPYDMVEDVWKFSFFRADKIGRYEGIENTDKRRLRGALLTSVKLFAEEGHIFATAEQAIETASRITGVEKELIRPQINYLVDEGRLVKSRGGLYLPVYYKAEKEGAERLASLINNYKKPPEYNWEIPTTDAEGHRLTEEQINAIKAVTQNAVTVITGGPGTGKTTAVRGLIGLLKDEDKKVVMTAPTGRAAKKMTELTGNEAKTIHRLLGFRRGEGYFNRNIDADILVIDEASMLEQVMFNHLLKAIKSDTRIVLVGDPDQLPPIGAGDVLKDMIESGKVPVIRLTENFRHVKGSGIAEGAISINKGKEPLSNDFDFIIINEEGQEKIREKVLKLVTEELPADLNIDAADIQIVTPQREGSLGAGPLNADLQEKINPDAPEIKKGLKRFRLGDRVVQRVNSSIRGVYNGETGKITGLDPDDKTLEVTFRDGKRASYTYNDIGELSLSYATTVHKMQGSETDYMVIPVSSSHDRLLYRNLIYSGVSRARKLCVLVGEKDAIKKAVENNRPIKRNSNFKKRLRDYIN